MTPDQTKIEKEKSTGDLDILVTSYLLVWLPKNKEKILRAAIFCIQKNKNKT